MLPILTTMFCEKCNKPFQQMEGITEKVCLECQFPKEEKKNAQEITIVPALLDASKLNESGETKEYRPTKWEEYKGQKSAKEKVQSYIEGCKKFGDIYPHTFISAPSGFGKTLFASILASQLNKKLIITTGGEIKSEQIFVDKLVEADGGIIFADEFNRLPKRVGFFILPILEQFSIGNKDIKKFTMIMATTHMGDISKDLDALIQRCDKITLEAYKPEELIEIAEQYRKKQYPSIQIPENILKEIVNSCRNTPRNVKNLVRAYAYNSDWNKIKEYNNIVKDGLTNIDINVLKYLEKTGGAGQQSIANFLRVKPQTYNYEIEPYLIFKELIEVNNKRMITAKGKEFLQNV